MLLSRTLPARFPASSRRHETSGTGTVARVVFDTDVLIDHLGGAARISSSFAGSAYSSISRAELYSWEDADEEIIDRLLAQFTELPVDSAVAEEAGRIRREAHVRFPDALIAAAAIVSKRPLLTRNLCDFEKIRRLSLYRSPRSG